MNRLNHLLQEIKPAIKTPWLNEAAKLPNNTINKHYANGAFVCSPKHAPAIVRALCAKFGGVVLGQYFLEYLGEQGFAANTPIRRLYFNEAEFVQWMSEEFHQAQATK